MTDRKTRRIGRKRWGALVRFLTDKMQNATSERVQMTAALRLADVLSLREQREQLELRRELRDAGKATDGPQGDAQAETSSQDQGRAVETAELAAEKFLASLRQRVTEAKEIDEQD